MEMDRRIFLKSAGAAMAVSATGEKVEAQEKVNVSFLASPESIRRGEIVTLKLQISKNTELEKFFLNGGQGRVNLAFDRNGNGLSTEQWNEFREKGSLTIAVSNVLSTSTFNLDIVNKDGNLVHSLHTQVEIRE